MITDILTKATEQVANPDIKDRAYIYWRMLSTSPQKTQDVVLGKKPNVASDTYNIYDEDLVDKLICGMGGLASIYHKTQGEWNKEQAKYAKKKMAPPPLRLRKFKKKNKRKLSRKKLINPSSQSLTRKNPNHRFQPQLPLQPKICFRSMIYSEWETQHLLCLNPPQDSLALILVALGNKICLASKQTMISVSDNRSNRQKRVLDGTTSTSLEETRPHNRCH